MKIFFIIVATLFYSSSQAQTTQKIDSMSQSSDASVPKFIAGNDSLINMLAVTAKAQAEYYGTHAGKYEYQISLKVETDSTVSEQRLLKDTDFRLGVQLMGYLELQLKTGRWKFIPAKQNGKSIARTIILIIPFEVTEQ